MTKEIQSWYDRTDMKKLALKSTKVDSGLIFPPYVNFENKVFMKRLTNPFEELDNKTKDMTYSIRDETFGSIIEFVADT